MSGLISQSYRKGSRSRQWLVSHEHCDLYVRGKFNSQQHSVFSLINLPYGVAMLSYQYVLSISDFETVLICCDAVLFNSLKAKVKWGTRELVMRERHQSHILGPLNLCKPVLIMLNKCVSFVGVTLLRIYSNNAAAVRNISIPFGFMTISIPLSQSGMRNFILCNHKYAYILCVKYSFSAIKNATTIRNFEVTVNRKILV
jgi:hypothetical protein